MSDDKQSKRPSSHRWAIGLLSIVTVGLTVTVIDFANRRSGAQIGSYLRDGIAFLLIGPIGLAGLVFGGRRRWGYYVAAGSLAVWISRGAYTTALTLKDFAKGHPVTKTYFHLAERSQPFVEQQRVSGAKEFLTVALLGLIAWLFVRFTFGQPSRRYYGFPADEKTTPEIPAQ